MSSANHKVIKEIKGVVEGHRDGLVEVYFKDYDSSILFPGRLFITKEEHQFGSTILYQVCEREDGTRYDRCIRTKSDSPNPYHKETMAILDNLIESL